MAATLPASIRDSVGSPDSVRFIWKWTKRVTIAGILTGIGAGLASSHFSGAESTYRDDEYRRQQIEATKADPEFQAWVTRQAEIRTDERLKAKIEDSLDRLYRDEKVDPKEAERIVTSFLQCKNPELMSFAKEISTWPRWGEVLAIAKQETSVCRTGVAVTYKNRIKTTSGGWQTYTTKIEGLRGISKLLIKAPYASMTVSEMNGTYCEHYGRECPSWTESVRTTIASLR